MSIEPGVPLISFVSPVYRCRECLHALVDEVAIVCGEIKADYEVIFVDDQCPENSWTVIADIAASNPRVRGIKLSRNFGQHSAIEAGLRHVSGSWVVVLDCDLQDHPRAVSAFWREAQSGAEVVVARRMQRTDAWHRRALSAAFYAVLRSLTGSNVSADVANFGLYKRKVIDAYNSWNEEQKYFPVMVNWLGFDQRTVDIPHSDRFAGKSAYNLKSLFRLGARIVLSFSDRPLWIMAGIGASVAMIAVITSIFYFARWLSGDIAVTGWASLILSVWFLGGVNIAAAGLIGIYLGRTLREAKGRPSFVVDRTVNFPA